MNKSDMRCIVREDWVDYACPCGAVREGRSWDMEDAALGWLAAHAPHSSGFVLQSPDASWSKYFAERPQDKRWQIGEPK